MASTSNAAHVLMKKGKRAAAVYIHADCSNSSPQHLNDVLNLLLNPAKSIDEWETIDWCKWLMAGGRTPDEFSSIVRTYDNATTCGLVWTPNFVAYRCRTCGISPCMSLCTECFKKGNHQCHDFNMFLSQAGGACDCGDTSVMKETGFCDKHGPNKTINKSPAPSDLMCVAEAMMPRIILRLIQHLRASKSSNPDVFRLAIQDADKYITMLLDFNNMGALMRRVMTTALTNPQKYKEALETPQTDSTYSQYMLESKKIYEEAIKSLPNPEPPDEYKDCPSLQEQLVHRTFLEELVFWTVKFEFPQKVVCLLLNMLPDPDYKDALTQAFVLHYSRISMMLERSVDPDTLSNRVVHVSVQLFSNESLALRMAENLNLLHVMVISLKYMMGKILIQNTLHDPDKNFHYVVDCSRQVMKEHCYWPLVSDLNNVLSHRPVAMKFMHDDALLEMWFAFLSMFQGMNVNVRELNQHIEFEPNTYYAAFSAELEASAYPMWALVSHLTQPCTVDYTKRVLNNCLTALQDWLDAVYFTHHSVRDCYNVSFHLPLHRYFAVFMCQAIKNQGVILREVLPPPDVLHLIMMHPLRVQVAFYEILSGLWVRNGLQIKGQAMTYIQSNFCNSMVDADIYLLQVCSTQLEPQTFISTLIDKFHIKECLSLAPYRDKSYLENELDRSMLPMLESCFTFLATLINVRTNLGITDNALNRLEMVTLLCMSDKTHSQLMELMPERCGTSQHRDFETLLAEVADYKAPNLEASGTMQQGMYVPKACVWEQQYDPLHVLLRAVHRRDFQSSMDRFTEYAKQSGHLKSCQTPWPPFREPAACSTAYEDPRKVLRTRLFHAMIHVVLYKAVHGHNVSEHCIALAIYLLEMAVITADRPNDGACHIYTNSSSIPRSIPDMDLENWFETDSLTQNLRTMIGKVTLTPEPEVFPTQAYGSDSSDIEWDASEADTEMMSDLAENSSAPLMLEENFENVSHNIIVIPAPNALMLNPEMSVVPEQSIAAIEEDDDSPTILALPPVDVDMAIALPDDLSMTTLEVQPGTSHAALMPPPPAPTGTEIAIPTTSSTSVPRKQYHTPKRRQVEAAPNPLIVKVNESIISLLLKLHSNLSGLPDSYKPYEEQNKPESSVSNDGDKKFESRIGDGPFFIANLLRKIAALDILCKENIVEMRNKLWPKQQDREEDQKIKESREREERRRRAKERQQKLMAEFASKQKQFMEKAMVTDESVSKMDWQGDEDSPRIPNKKEYDCVICNQTTPSTEEKPMGLVVLVQSSSVVGYKRRTPERVLLPTCETERIELNLKRDYTLASEFDRRIEDLDRHFDSQSWLLSVNIGWEGGVHVQTCGHHLHLDCLISYLQSLRGQQRQQSLAVERGEYLCPLCRQLANSVLPLSPQLGECSAVVRSRPGTMHAVIMEIQNFLKENQCPLTTSNLTEAMKKAMEDMTNSTQLKFKQKVSSPQWLFLFMTSIARTNLEIEVVQRGGSLCPLPQNSSMMSLMPKRDCIVPLLHVLAVHARVLAKWPVWKTWQQLVGLQDSPTSPFALTVLEREVPLLLQDPTALLIQFILLLPLHIDQTYFSCVVKTLYNLLHYQVVAQLTCNMSANERDQILIKKRSATSSDTLLYSLGTVIEVLGQSELYIEDEGTEVGSASTSHGTIAKFNIQALEQEVQKLCLPFLRIAALLRHHLYQQSLPDVRSPQCEFVRLVYYLELVTEGMDWDCFNSAVALNWSSKLCETETPRLWCEQLAAFIFRGQIAARTFLIEQHITRYPPRLLSLPREYEKIFTYYHERQCSQCHSVPVETSVCLLCGTVVCLKQTCCKTQNVCEAVQHSIDCGGGTGIYLVVTSTYIIVIRGRRACLWGSLYLDDFEEEDRDLKRGKPLYLSQDRFQLLEQQWLAHRFDHTKKTWVWHRDAL